MRVKELKAKLALMHPESTVFIECVFDTAVLDDVTESDFATCGKVTLLHSAELIKILGSGGNDTGHSKDRL